MLQDRGWADNDSRLSVVSPVGGSGGGVGGALIAMSQDHLQEDKERHEEAEEIPGKIQLTPRIVAVPPLKKGLVCVIARKAVVLEEGEVDHITWRDQPSDAKEECASVADHVRLYHVPVCHLCLERPYVGYVRDDGEDQGQPYNPFIPGE